MTPEQLDQVRGLIAKSRTATKRRAALVEAAVALGVDHWAAAMVLVGLSLRRDFEELGTDCIRLAEAEMAEIEKRRAA